MKLKKYLSGSDLSQVEFACSIGQSPQNVSRYVNGDRIPEPAVMQKIVDATKGAVTANDFYGVVLPKATGSSGKHNGGKQR